MIFKRRPYYWSRKDKFVEAKSPKLRETPRERELTQVWRSAVNICSEGDPSSGLFDPGRVPDEGPEIPIRVSTYPAQAIFWRDTYDKELLLQVYEQEKKRLEQAPEVSVHRVGMWWLRLKQYFANDNGYRSRYGIRRSIENRYDNLPILFDGIVWAFRLAYNGKPDHLWVAIDYEGYVVHTGRCIREMDSLDYTFTGGTPYNLLTWALGPGLAASGLVKAPESPKLEAWLQCVKPLQRVLEKIPPSPSGGSKLAGFEDNRILIQARLGIWRCACCGEKFPRPLVFFPAYVDSLISKRLQEFKGRLP